MTILSANNINRVEWSKLVASSATGTWFQSVEAYEFFASMPELFKPFVIGLENDGVLRAVCVGYITVEKDALKQIMTRRAIVVGGSALADDATDDEVQTLMQAVRKELRQEAIYIETRNFNDYSKWKDAFEKAGFNYKEHLNFHVDCQDEKAMWERLSDNRKRQVRKGDSIEVALLQDTKVTEEEIREWYAVLANLYRTKVKTPLWPVEFFLEAYRQKVGRFMLVRHEGKIIGGSMVVMDGKAVYEWFECGMNADYKEQYPSVMATWAGMQYANEHGCARYDMMGAGMPEVPYGVRDFKAEFGGKMVEHGRFIYVSKPMLYLMGKFGVKLLKHLR